ncbi:hypothetical protein GGX14DRAFT_572282 [Mycena pura]|uniref:Uncharacterized protein n=1 Tax=Mycena pura TaxID=153505 RepID=A0AAD6V5N0_9AGAR|nr:hypothetical protein GGX14DRAFT_572282 [Mycena pura]
MPPTRSDAERTFIGLFPHATLESFRASISNDSHVLTNPNKFLTWDWVDVAELRRWLEQRDAPAPATCGIKSEPVDGALSATAASMARPAYRIVMEGKTEIEDSTPQTLEKE